METPILIAAESPAGSGGRRSSVSSSPEFEFWKIRNPSLPQPDLLSADELFSGGVLLPLDHFVSPHPSGDPPDPDPAPNPESLRSGTPIPEPDPDAAAGPQITAAAPPELSLSKRWRDIFKKSDKRAGEDKEKEKEKKKDKSKGGGGGPSSAELNINLWPFARSRSAGTGGGRPKMAAAGARKASSAPCSRSNSAGESKSRKWPSSPGRPGVHLGRASPVWQARRGVRNSEPPARNAAAGKGVRKETAASSRRNKAQTPSPAAAAAGAGGAKARVLNLNVPMCIGYRHHLSCRSDEKGDLVPESGRGSSGEAPVGVGVAGAGGRGSHLFNLRGLFAKKVY